MSSKAIQKRVEKKIADLLRPGSPKPDREDLQILSIAVKYLAVAAKMEEGEWGSELTGLSENDELEEGEDEQTNDKDSARGTS